MTNQEKSKSEAVTKPHITNGGPCWCNPTMVYKDAKNQNEVWLHHQYGEGIQDWNDKRKILSEALNKIGIDNILETQDFILADLLLLMFEQVRVAIKQRNYLCSLPLSKLEVSDEDH